MNSIVFSASSIDQIEENIQNFLGRGLTPTLAIIFSSVTHNFKEFGPIFAKHDIDVFGASSSGEIANDEVYESTIVAMILDINRDYYKLNMFEGERKTSYQVGQGVADWAKTIYHNPAFMVISAGLHADGEQIVNGIIDGMKRQVPLFGGLAGDDLKARETFVFTSSQLLNNGVLALIFDQTAVDLRGVAVSGWKGVGTAKTITKATGNVVYSIDGMPALDVYHKYLNITDETPFMHAAEYPLHLMREDGSYVLRSVMTINKDKSMVFAGTVPEGAQVRFSTAPGFEIIASTIEQMASFKKQIPKAIAIVLFSCVGRNLQLGPMMKDEISSIRKLWNLPLVGFFTYGEIGPMMKGRCDFHNQTLVLVLIHEKHLNNRPL